MQTIFSVLTVAFAIASFISATDGPNAPLNPRPITPHLLGVAMFFLFVTLYVGYRKAKRQALESARREAAMMPTQKQITDALAKLRRVIDGESEPMPQPPDGAMVDCEQCEVVEHFPVGNDAARSAHLTTHPERCRVICNTEPTV